MGGELGGGGARGKRRRWEKVFFEDASLLVHSKVLVAYMDHFRCTSVQDYGNLSLYRSCHRYDCLFMAWSILTGRLLMERVKRSGKHSDVVPTLYLNGAFGSSVQGY